MPTIYIIGDSLAATKDPSKKPETGWGECLADFIPDSYRVENHAVYGRSTKSFIDEKRLEVIDQKIQKDDILLIQFGHNDQKKEDPLRYTDPYTTYTYHLEMMIQTARLHEVYPILITSVSRRAFTDYHLLDANTLGDYPYQMISIARQLKTPVIDIFQTTQALIATLGEEGSKRLFLHLSPLEHPNYPEGVIDNTHLSPEGARLIASLIALELKPYLVKP